MKKNTHSGHTPFSYTKLFSKSISNALNVELLLLQGMMLALSLLAFVVFSSFMGLVVFLTAILSFSSGFPPLGIFVLLFGFAVWALGMIAINAFLNGVQYHLSMQAVTRKPFDLNLAWKLSSARWRDAFYAQGSLIGFFVGLFILSFIVSIIVSGNANWAGILLHPNLWSVAGLAPILVIVLALLTLQPFFLLMFPIVYFEHTKPLEIPRKLHAYVKPHYYHLMGAILLLIGINLLITRIADVMAILPAAQSPVRDTALTFVLFTGFAFFVQVVSIVVAICINLNTQALLYLHIGKPDPKTHFVTQGKWSTAVSKLAHSHPSHSGYLPVKWKRMGTKRRKYIS